MPIQSVSLKSTYIAFTGGLDVATPPFYAAPGTLRDSINMVESPMGGYERVKGYRRYDGQNILETLGSQTLVVTLTAPVLPGDIIIQDESTAICIDIRLDHHGRTIMTVIGDALAEGGFLAYTQTNIFVWDHFYWDDFFWTESAGGVPAGDILPIVPDLTRQIANELQLITAGAARDHIQPVPGSGGILGLFVWAGVLYAFRNSDDGSEAWLYHVSTSGWQKVDTGVTLLAGGRYEFIYTNFTGDPQQSAVYGCDGVNKAFRFDGSFTQISTGMAEDSPNHICEHANHLFLSFGASLQWSAVGLPMIWKTSQGAGEVVIGEQITNLLTIPGSDGTQALLVTGEDTTSILYGTGNDDFQLRTFRANAGAVARSAKNLEQTWMLDNFGITALATTQAYGNFAGTTSSQRVDPILVARRNNLLDTFIRRAENKYCLLFTDGYCLVCQVRHNNKGAYLASVMPVQYPAHIVTSVASIEMPDGGEAVFFGSADGMVYREGGNNFDGEEIEWDLTFHYNTIKSPNTVKKFRKLDLDYLSDGFFDATINTYLDYQDKDIVYQTNNHISSESQGFYWDNFHWDNFFWEGEAIRKSRVELHGNGRAWSMRLHGKSAINDHFALSGAIILFSPTRDRR